MQTPDMSGTSFLCSLPQLGVCDEQQGITFATKISEPRRPHVLAFVGGTRAGLTWYEGQDVAAEGSEVSSNGIGLITINGSERIESLLRALGDGQARKILCSAIETGKTIKQIGAEQDIPLSTCHRKLKTLVNYGFMIVEKIVVTDEGKKIVFYRSTFGRIIIAMNGGLISANVAANPRLIDRLDQRRSIMM